MGEQARLVEALRRALSARLGVAAALIETHISFVLVCGAHAYKIKKALRTEFLDQSTLTLRKRACQEELRLNRRLAADLYLDVVAVTGSVDAPELVDAGAAIDYAVKMRAFAQEGLWDRLAARHELQRAHIDELVRLLAAFHGAAPVADPEGHLGSPASVRAPVLAGLDELDGLVDADEDRARLRQLRRWESAAYSRLWPALARRLAQGRVRECHGDLHLGNVTMIDGRTTVFDGIEFNDEFRWIDVMSEVAFMTMDLHAHGLTPLAHRFVNGWLEASGDYDGVRVLDYYLVHRALVRAKVALLLAAQCSASKAGVAQHTDEATVQRARARHYLELALSFTRRQRSDARPVLMVTHGLSGSGKSTLTQGLVEAAGAIRIRADVERKRLAGLQPLARSGTPASPDVYGDDMTAATYAQLGRFAVDVLAGGYHAILDATFLRRDQRDEARRLAARQGVSFFILAFEADADVLRKRLRQRAARGDDPSEADERVLAAQMRSAEPLQPDETGAVFHCRPLAASAGIEAQVDWVPLLQRIAANRPVEPICP